MFQDRSLKIIGMAMALGLIVYLSGCGPAVGDGDMEPEPPDPSGGSVIPELRIMGEDGVWQDHRARSRYSENEPAKFVLRVRNVGNARGAIRLREHQETPEPHGYSKFFYVDDLDITDDVKGAGWYTPALDPEEELYVMVELGLRPEEERPGAGQGRPDLQSRIIGFADGSEFVFAKAESGEAEGVIPEVRARRKDGAWVRNLEGSVPEGNTISVDISIKNIGTNSGRINVIAYTEDGEGWEVKSDAHGAIFSDGWSSSYNVGETKIVNVDITPKGASKGDIVTLMVGGVADTYDYVTIKVEMKGMFQPDLHLKVDGQPEFIGEDLYDRTGQSQRLQVETDGNEVVKYLVRIENDGDLSDMFRLTEAGFGGAWIARYYDSPAGGTEITDLIRGGGWVTPGMDIGETKTIRVEVNPAGVDVNARLELLLTASSEGYERKKDAVIMGVEKIEEGLRIKEWREEPVN